MRINSRHTSRMLCAAFMSRSTFTRQVPQYFSRGSTGSTSSSQPHSRWRLLVMYSSASTTTRDLASARRIALTAAGPATVPLGVAFHPKKFAPNTTTVFGSGQMSVTTVLRRFRALESRVSRRARLDLDL